MRPQHYPRPAGWRPVHSVTGSPAAQPAGVEICLLRLEEDGEPVTLETGSSEAVLDVLAGRCAVQAEGPWGSVAWGAIGERPDPFRGLPTMVYLPRGTRITLSAVDDACEALMALTPAQRDHPVRLVGPRDADTKTVGKGNWQRRVVTSIGTNVDADALIVGETLNPPGNWSSAPPHKHDTVSANEAPMREVYHYRLQPRQGFALQRVYTPADDPAPYDVTFTVRDGDTIAIPRGYHPVVAAPGYALCYVWVLAGETRRYGAWSDDPEHAWVKDAG